MPGTIASITDPALVSSTTTASSSAASAPTPNSSNIQATAADPTALASATAAAAAESQPGSRRPSAHALLQPLSLFDPARLSSQLQQQEQEQEQEHEQEDGKAAIVSAPLPHSLVTPEPIFPGTGGPGSGVALTSASSANLILHSATSSAIAPTNTPARMTVDLAKNTMSSSSQQQATLTQRKNASGAASQSGTNGHSANSNLVQFVETTGHFSLVRNFHLADAFTLMNGFCGAQSLFASGRYLVTSDPIHAWHALWFPLFGAIFDLLDGKVARWRNSSSMLGQELDSLADSTSFGAAPAFAAFALGLRLPLDTLILTGFVCAGIARLARFNVTTASIPHDPSGKARYFEGLPIPSSLILVGGMALCLLFGRFESAGGIGNVVGTAGNAAWWDPAQLLVSDAGTAWNAIKAHASLPVGRTLVFTGRLASSSAASTAKKLVGASTSGVPLGILNLDVFGLVEKVAGQQFAQEYARVHTISLLWLAWSAAMVSKTLHVPKP